MYMCMYVCMYYRISDCSCSRLLPNWDYYYMLQRSQSMRVHTYIYSHILNNPHLLLMFSCEWLCVVDSQIDIPRAPGLGLLLDGVRFDWLMSCLFALQWVFIHSFIRSFETTGVLWFIQQTIRQRQGSCGAAFAAHSTNQIRVCCFCSCWSGTSTTKPSINSRCCLCLCLLQRFSIVIVFVEGVGGCGCAWVDIVCVCIQDKYIYSAMIETEKTEQVMIHWLSSLDYHTYNEHVPNGTCRRVLMHITSGGFSYCALHSAHFRRRRRRRRRRRERGEYRRTEQWKRGQHCTASQATSACTCRIGLSGAFPFVLCQSHLTLCANQETNAVKEDMEMI